VVFEAVDRIEMSAWAPQSEQSRLLEDPFFHDSAKAPRHVHLKVLPGALCVVVVVGVVVVVVVVGWFLLARSSPFSFWSKSSKICKVKVSQNRLKRRRKRKFRRDFISKGRGASDAHGQRARRHLLRG